MHPIFATAVVGALALFAPPEEPAGASSPSAPGATPGATPSADPSGVDGSVPAGPEAPVAPTADDLAVEYELPYAAEDLALSEALSLALEQNMDLATTLADVQVSETSVLSAQAAFDVIITAGLQGQIQESTPRGSAFVFSTGSRSVSAYFGVGRKLETGGRVDLRFDISRTLTNQPISFFQPELGSATLAQYQITPRLQLTHPLLRGMGLKVNRVPIERAQLAATQSEAQAQVTAQNLVRDIVSAYWDVLFSARDLENKHRSLELAREQLTRTEAQVRAGRLAPVDLKAVEQSLATREQEVLLAETSLLESSLNLRTLLGDDFAQRRPVAVLPQTSPEAFDPRPVDIEASIDMAMQANPQVRQLQLALSSRRLDELEAANQRLVQLDFTGTFSPQGRSVDTAADIQSGAPEQRGSWGEAFRNFINDDISQDGLFSEFTVTGALDLTWDVQNKGGKANHQRTLIEVRKAEVNLKQMQQTISTSVFRAANSLRAAQKRMEVADVSVGLAEDNLAAEEARFMAGRSTNYDVLQRIDAMLTAQTTALNAQIDYLKARAQLQALTGEILPAYGLALQNAPQ